MKTIASFIVSEEAYLLRSFLEMRGIRSYVFDEYMIQQIWYYSNAIGGVRVVVSEEDFIEAERECSDYFESIREGGSTVTAVRAWPVVLLLSLIAGYPLMIFGRKKNKLA